MAKTTAEYLCRKRRELTTLNAKLRVPCIIPDALGMDDVIELKFRIRSMLLAEAITGYSLYTETNSIAGAVHAYYDYRLDYYYQRYDLSIHGPDIYPHLGAMGADGGALLRTLYAASGMSALAALFFSLDRAGATAWSVVAYADTLFETQHLIAQMTCLELRTAATPEELHRTLADLMPGERGICLLLDSILAGDYAAETLLRLQPHTVDLLLFDTTCYEIGSDRIARAIDIASVLNIPLVLVRSHLKLGFLGVEYGRLGSLVLAAGAAVPEPGRKLLEALAVLARDTISVTGMGPVVAHLIPFAGDPEFRALNRERIERIAENNAMGAEHLHRALRAEGFHVVAYHHGMFLSIEFPQRLDRDSVLPIVEQLCASAIARGMPVRRAGSFGFDFIAVSDFVDLRRSAPCIRVALSDHPAHIILSFCDFLAQWCLDRQCLLRREGGQSGSGRIPVYTVPGFFTG